MFRVSLSTPTETAPRVVWTQLYIGLGFTTLASLILELSLTRIFSVVFNYHMAFLVISIALFGLGAGGVFSYVISSRRENIYRWLGTLSVVNSFAVVAALWFVLSRTNDRFSTITAVYMVSAIPFFFAGIIVSTAIAEAIERVDRAYFFDLAGAAAGCLLLIPFLKYFGGPDTVVAAAVLYGIAGSIWFHQAGAFKSRAFAVVLALLLVAVMLINGRTHTIDIRIAKGRRLPQERFVAWNNISRVGIERVDVSWEPQALWTIIIDGDAGTGIAPFDWSKGLTPEERAGLLHEGPGFPYAFKPGAKTLIIGPGGGYDVARSLASGSKDISAVEINPIIANNVMRGVMLQYSHGIYLRPELRVFIEDGRSFVRRSAEKYQVIQATLVDTWASTAAGAFALSENSLYTADAFYDYLSHLTDDGVVAFTRWGFEKPRESLRLVTLAMDALARLGETQPSRHILAMREHTAELLGWGALDTVVIARKPLSQADVDRARSLMVEGKLEPLYLPGGPPRNPFGELLLTPDPKAYLAAYPYDVSAVTDDRPFFFYTVQPRDVWDFVKHASTGTADYKVNRALPVLFGVLAASLLATVLVMVLPRIVLGQRLPKEKGVMSFLWYFVCLGAGYILIQVALIQKFVLLLGHPTYALTVIVFSMLVASGLGSFFSRSAVAGDDTRLIRVLGAIAILVAALAFAASPMVSFAAAWPLPAKVILTAASIIPAAFLMGMPFPSGLRRLEKRHAPSVRWAWSLNAAASVMGSASAIFLAIYLGLRNTILIGAAMYVCALFVILATRNAAKSQVN